MIFLVGHVSEVCNAQKMVAFGVMLRWLLYMSE